MKHGGMKHHEWSLYPAILAVVTIGLLAFGVPRSALIYAAFALACPLIMILAQGSAARHRRGRHNAEGHGQGSIAGRW